MRFRLLTIGLVISVLLALSVATSAADNSGTTIRQLRAQVTELKAEKAKLVRQRNTARATRDVWRRIARASSSAEVALRAEAQTDLDNLATTQSDLEQERGNSASLNSRLLITQAALAGQVSDELSAMTRDQLWALLPQVSAQMQQGSAVCAYSSAYSNNGTFASFDFAKYAC